MQCLRLWGWNKMKGWNKIDLHQHTLNELTYDGKCPKTSYTHKAFEELLLKEDVKLKAVTNHNTLNLSDHIKHALICEKNGIQYLPGVEIDYLFEKKDVHGITIINPQCDVIPFSIKLTEYVNNKGENKYLTKEEFANVHENLEFIFIPHIMKTKGIYPSANKPPIKDAEDWVMSMIGNGIFVPVIFENTQDYFKYSVYAKIEQYFGEDYENPPCYAGSDYKFDNDERRKQMAINRVKYYINAEPTYRGLEISIRNHETRISHENELIQRNNYLQSAEILPSQYFCGNNTLDFSPYLNVIIGGSGTGKTLLLNEIYRKITGNDLHSVYTKDKKNKAYYSKTGNADILNLYSLPDDYSNFKVVEIPNIYTEIMKYVNDTSKLSEVFGISNTTYINTIINEYLSNCILYEELVSSKNENKTNGQNELSNIISSIAFMDANKNNNSVFNLKVENRAEKKSDKLENVITANKNLLSKHDTFVKYIKDIGIAVGKDSSEIVNEIIKLYEQLLNMLREKNKMHVNTMNEYLIEEKIELLINEAIKATIAKLGQKEQAYKTREEVLNLNVTKLSENIRSYIKSEYKSSQINLIYPYELMKKTIEEKNSTQLARFTMSMAKDDFRSIDVTSENLLIDSSGKLTKLRKLKKQTINFNNDKSVKEFIDELINQKISIQDLLVKEIPLKLELYTESEWKDATSINQGTIAKISMKYYFEDLIKNEQPDIVFIDQPENDVDKEFLTNTLALFLLKQKLTTQIFITSHDPILTVNADANMIIQADVDDNNKINYISYPLEFTENRAYGTDKVAALLDGGKPNIKKRYQIYGGILKYGN